MGAGFEMRGRGGAWIEQFGKGFAGTGAVHGESGSWVEEEGGLRRRILFGAGNRWRAARGARGGREPWRCRPSIRGCRRSRRRRVPGSARAAAPRGRRDRGGGGRAGGGRGRRAWGRG